MITVVDYGVGNVQAFLNVYKRLNVPARRAAAAGELEGASKIILPGVGDFDHAMARLGDSGMLEPLRALVLEQRLPLLGICVGMQMLARSSDEGARPGLGWVDGRVRGFRSAPAAAALPTPHMGWNDVRPLGGGRLFEGLDAPRFYFLHSYYFECDRAEDSAAVAGYGLEFTCAVAARNVYGVQFHPEKSHHWGTRLLKNFADL